MDEAQTAGRLDRRIAGRYRLTEVISAGGSGTVWTAVDEVLGREVAIKDVVASPYSDSQDRELVREHTLREAQAACRVDHPNVVQVYDLVEQDERPWIVMQLVKAPSLAELIQLAGPCAPHQAAVFGLQLLEALRAIHAHGVTHRDVKPSNVLIDGDRAVLTDFGIATIEDDAPPAPPDSLVGAPSYIAPECIRGEPATAASDLWSLGATLYTAVEGRPPHLRDGAHATLLAVATDEPDPIRLAGMLAPLLTELLRKEPAQRPGADHVEHRLRRLIALHENTDDGGTATCDPAADEVTAAHRRPAVTAPDRSRSINARLGRRRATPKAAIAAAVAALTAMLAGLVLQPRNLSGARDAIPWISP